MVRIVRQPDGVLVVDRQAPGRGAWLCRESPDCLERAVRQRRFERAFRLAVDPAHLQQLSAQLGVAWGRPAPDVRG